MTLVMTAPVNTMRAEHVNRRIPGAEVPTFSLDPNLSWWNSWHF